MCSVERVDGLFEGDYSGWEQRLDLGSCVQVDDSVFFDALEDFTVGAWVHPSFNPSSYEPPDLDNIDPFNPPTLTIAPMIETQTVGAG
jgi:hypothetical protein